MYIYKHDSHDSQRVREEALLQRTRRHPAPTAARADRRLFAAFFPIANQMLCQE